MKRKQLKLGIFGFGCVGTGLYQTLSETTGIQANIVKICVKDRTKYRPFPTQDYFTFDRNDILNNPEVDVVVELMDDADAAFQIVTTALKNGKAVVTANKKLIAEHLDHLISISQQYNTPLLYEAACCASIPVIRNLEEYYDNDLLSSVSGIFNGSTNYILTKIADEGIDYGPALEMAIDKGFAETDPTYDIKGWDSRYKLSIIIAHAFGLIVQPSDILSIGIDQVKTKDIQYAREKGLLIKLVASAQREGNEVLAVVAPKFVSKSNVLATVNNEYNAVQITGAFSEQQLFIGKGAGGFPTGAAVLSDISALTFAYRYEYKKLNQKDNIVLAKDFLVEVYMSFEDQADINFDDFHLISESYVGKGHSYIIGQISSSQLKKQKWSENPSVSVILIGKIGQEKANNLQHELAEIEAYCE
jgi:homoserine dehydrogenase